jgi:hypothetical protein
MTVASTLLLQHGVQANEEYDDEEDEDEEEERPH